MPRSLSLRQHQEPASMSEYAELPLPRHHTVAVEALTVTKAQAFVAAIELVGFATLFECVKITGTDDPFFRVDDEVIIFDLTPEVGQQPINDIRFVERMAVHFDARDEFIPWVFALRSDFPKVVHLNALHFEQPACLCLYENSYDELRVDWRAVRFLHDIRHWLELTSRDELHQADQALEPFLIGNSGTIIIPPDFKADETLYVYLVAQRANRVSLLGSRILLNNMAPFPAQVLLLKSEPRAHGTIGMTPNNLTDLHQLLTPIGIDLMTTIRDKFREIAEAEGPFDKHLMIMLELPKSGRERSFHENDYYVFLTEELIEDIGLQLNFYAKDPDTSKIGNIHFEKVKPELGNAVAVSALLPQVQLTPDWALVLSGNAHEQDLRELPIFQIGTGALGSQFFMNNARSGFGRWVLTDHDFLLPHNTVRHASDMTYMGNLKSYGLAATANQFFGGDQGFAFAFAENYLHPSQNTDYAERLATAAIIVDASTSIAVARHLAHRTDINGRRISMFLSPNGLDLVILAEDEARECRLDQLEFQYYQQLFSNPVLAGHLDSDGGIRLSNSCRDITARIAQEHVAIHAGIATSQFRRVIRQKQAFIGLWRYDRKSGGVTPIAESMSGFDLWNFGDWQISVTQQLVEKIATARLSKLPKETGGILIGGFDFEHKKIYLTDTILSPKDSKEYPTAYVRGIDGVEEMLMAYSEKTADHLKYAGEWHSHPENCALSQSDDDQKLFYHIHVEMDALGFPTIMLIAGDDGAYEIYFQP